MFICDRRGGGMNYLVGRCCGCGSEIVRRCFRASSETLSYVCECSPKLEVMKTTIIDGKILVVWEESSV